MSRPATGRRESARCGLVIALALFFGLAPAVSSADVYGYIDEQGVARFAAEKLDDRYQLLSKGNRFGMLTLGGDGSARSALKERLLAHPNLKRYEPLLKAHRWLPPCRQRSHPDARRRRFRRAGQRRCRSAGFP